MSQISYKDAGVDIDAGNSFVENIKPLVKSTKIPGVLGGIGSFAGAFELPRGFKEPVMLAATDGVGTKLKLAIDSGIHNTVGIDLVAMCVNDLLCNFGTPSFFLDYYATGKLDVKVATDVVAGIAEGCIRAECALIGGETAEMPGMYSHDDYDLAGFAVGVAEKGEMDRVSMVRAGHKLIALPSSGLHSNGFSLARKVLFEKMNLNRIYARHLGKNPASGKVMKKIGMKYEGLLRNHEKKWGEYEDLLYYGLLKEEYNSKNN